MPSARRASSGSGCPDELLKVGVCLFVCVATRASRHGHSAGHLAAQPRGQRCVDGKLMGSKIRADHADIHGSC